MRLAALVLILVGQAYVPMRFSGPPSASSLGQGYNVLIDWHPFIRSEPLDVSISLYSGTKKAFYVQYLAYQNDNLIIASNNRYEMDETLKEVSFIFPSDFTKGESFHGIIDFTVMDKTSFSTITYYSRRVDLKRILSDRVNMIYVDNDLTYQSPEVTYRTNYEGASPSSSIIRKTYSFSNIYKIKDGGENRGIGLKDYSFRYDDGLGNNALKATASLRILKHKEDFPTSVDYGGYSSFDLKLTTKRIEGTPYYCFALKKTNRYDQISLLIDEYRSCPYYFLSTELFVPIGLNHDYDEYDFQILLSVPSGETFVFNRKFKTDYLHFGPSSSSSYSLHGDMNA